ncbi:DUF6544 family protein [Sagittula sp. S175]|uniref:DUF6544 family protein n=1 Tax=Sagittula sp. S175 TaxID=3415129 RepID=UPI003C7977E2
MRVILIGLGLVVLVVALAGLGLGALRWWDTRIDARSMQYLKAQQAVRPEVFDLSMLEGLPEPAQRYYRFALAEGTPLWTLAELRMRGTLTLNGVEQPMEAVQVLAPPHGFVWQVELTGKVKASGSDAMVFGDSWSRFRLFGLLPVARAGGADHLRSSFGRRVGEGVFWTPAAYLPAAEAGWETLAWEASGTDVARVTVRSQGMEQSVEITVDGEGRPVRVLFPRWSQENTARVWQWQPFGGDLGGWEEFDGVRVPADVEGGNHYGTADYVPFFKARVTEVRFRR